jgi:hypothetical protein
MNSEAINNAAHMAMEPTALQTWRFGMAELSIKVDIDFPFSFRHRVFANEPFSSRQAKEIRDWPKKWQSRRQEMTDGRLAPACLGKQISACATRVAVVLPKRPAVAFG